MNKQLSIALAGITAVSSVFSFNANSLAETPDKYFCGTSSDGVPTTFARDVIGKKIAVIRWEKEWGGNYTPQKRCELVSANFQKAYENGALENIGYGNYNGHTVVCAMKDISFPNFNDKSESKTDCTYHLFTLRLGSDGETTVKSLLEVGSSAGAPLVQSDSWKIYELGEFFREVPNQ